MGRLGPSYWRIKETASVGYAIFQRKKLKWDSNNDLAPKKVRVKLLRGNI
jgi:hypothetical protein